ncbi:MAG TPA: hypothetical protein VMM80_11930 [Bacteroidota bacterium]|nr:hypothetical protein [Bacteroidota bacterium]
MTCEEFHVAFNAWLDGRMSAPLPPDARRHSETCAACARYAGAMERLDAGLRAIPRVEMPGALIALPDRLSARDRARGDRGPIAAAARLWAPALGPAVAVWCAAAFLPPGWTGVLSFILATSGLVMFGVATLRPRFFSP